MNKKNNEVQQQFDSAAANWDSSVTKQTRNVEIYQKIMELCPLQKNMVLADYGCATGSVTALLYPHVQQVDAFDFSSMMLEELRKKVQQNNWTSLNTLVLDLQTDNFSHENYYDVIISTMTMHHIENVLAVLKKFASALKIGGSLLIADLDKEDGSFHAKGSQGIYHNGFAREQFKSWLQEAGFGEIEIVTAHVIKKENKEYPVFLIKGVKQK